MAFDPFATVRALHVVFAVLWAGGAIFMAAMISPTLRAAGPAAGPFMMTAMRRGGFGPFFGITATLAILTGGYVYGTGSFHEGAFQGGRLFLTIGVAAALVAYAIGILIVLPNEARIKRLIRGLPTNGPPPQEDLAKLQQMGARQARHSAHAAALIGLALLAMTFYKVF